MDIGIHMHMHMHMHMHRHMHIRRYAEPTTSMDVAKPMMKPVAVPSPTSPRPMHLRVRCNPDPLLNYGAPIIGMPMSPRAFGGAGKPINRHTGTT